MVVVAAAAASSSLVSPNDINPRHLIMNAHINMGASVRGVPRTYNPHGNICWAGVTVLGTA